MAALLTSAAEASRTAWRRAGPPMEFWIGGVVILVEDIESAAVKGAMSKIANAVATVTATKPLDLMVAALRN